jgi:hypothetical protein
MMNKSMQVGNDKNRSAYRKILKSGGEMKTKIKFMALLMLVAEFAFTACGGESSSNHTAAPYQSWTRLTGATSRSAFCMDIAVDPSGDTYVTGSTSGSLDG